MRLTGFLCWIMLLGSPLAAAQSSVPDGQMVRPSVTTLAGATKQTGHTDGPGTAARFNRPMGIALAPDGTLYVADARSHTIRRVSPTGLVTTFAGTAGVPGRLDGTGAAARFNSPVGLALDARGTLYVTDAENQTIRQITPAGVVTTLAGQAGARGNTDGPGPQARFNYPHGIVVAANGVVYVTDTNNHTIRCISPAGDVTTWAGATGRKGSADGVGTAARFFRPTGLALGPDDTLFLVDNGNYIIRAVSPAGEVRTLAGRAGQAGSADGPGPAARFDWPNGIAVDARGYLYVADNVNSTVRRLTPAGETTTLAGQPHRWGSQDGPGPEAQFEFPFGVAVTADGSTLYLTDTANQLVRTITLPR